MVLDGYSGFLHQLQLPNHELATLRQKSDEKLKFQDLCTHPHGSFDNVYSDIDVIADFEANLVLGREGVLVVEHQFPDEGYHVEDDEGVDDGIKGHVRGYPVDDLQEAVPGRSAVVFGTLVVHPGQFVFLKARI